MCPLFISSTHHKILPKYFVHSPPKGARCSDIAWRKCGADVWTQGAVALLSAWHQHTIKLSKFSSTYWASSHFPKNGEMGPRGGKHLESWKQAYTALGARETLPHRTWLLTNIGFALETNGRTVFRWEQEPEVEPGPGVEPRPWRESLINSIQGTHLHPP